MKIRISTVAAIALFAIAPLVGATAQAATSTPCVDGTTSTAVGKGACSGHGGVKSATSKTKSASKVAPTKTKTGSKTAPTKTKADTTKKAAPSKTRGASKTKSSTKAKPDSTKPAPVKAKPPTV